MTAERWQQIESLFVQAVECAPGEQAAFLDRVCEGDVELRQELESLLACDAPDQRLAQIPALPTTPADLSGQRIGSYRLIRLLGHGGMGAVYLGVRDDDQYQKQVAIKLLKRGMDTDFLLGRFRQERQILANLEHPFIARLLDGGATAEGLPYFVMEYVDGVPITRYCTDKGLSVPERVRLFRLVCEAVQYAHQNLVVHRDLKPGNILATKEGIPKLLDFGIAKALDPEMAAGTTLTQREQRLLTPDYASPEQVKGERISTASDTYSLGVVLYELLAGVRPHRFASGSVADLERTICEVEPEKPSLAAGQENCPAAVRKQLRRQLAGDLDNIILTALRKEPARRYPSVADLSEDLRRHLEGQAVLAQEDRWSYRAGKFIRRNRLGVAAGLLLITSLVGGIVATTLQARRAERRFAIARQLAKAVLADVKGPMWRLPGSTALRASMLQTVVQYLDGLAQDPGRDAAFDLEIANAYREVGNLEGSPFQQNLGQTAAALDHYQKAIAIYARLINRTEAKVSALGGLIGTNIEAGDIETRTGNAAAAKARLQGVVALASEATARDSAAVLPGTQVYLYFRLTGAETAAGNVQQALVYARKALEVCVPWAAAEHSVNARSTLRGAYSIVAGAQLRAGDLYGARENYVTALRQVEEATRQPDATVYERSTLSAAHQNLGDLLGNPEDLNFGDRPGAISHYRVALEIVEAIAAADRPDVRARDELASAYRNFGAVLLEERPAEALKFYQQATAISEGLSAAEPSNTAYRRDTALGQAGIGKALHGLGKNRDALLKLIPALDTMKSLAQADPDQLPLKSATSRIHRAIGDASLASGADSGALENYQQALTASEDLLRRAPSSLYFQRENADSMESLGKYYASKAGHRPELRTEARSWLQKSLAVWRDWYSRQLALPYAGVRERQVAALLASLD